MLEVMKGLVPSHIAFNGEYGALTEDIRLEAEVGETILMTVRLPRVLLAALVAIPLFTFAGYLVGESNAPRRLVRLTDALFGWMPGGLAVVVELTLEHGTHSGARCDPELARDIAQDCFLRLHRAAASYRHRGRFIAYLSAIVLTTHHSLALGMPFNRLELEAAP